MKKTFLTVGLIAVFSATTLSANAFCWSNLNPFTWGSNCCGAAASCKCKQEKKCNPCKKTQKCCPTKNPCETTPKCNPCETQNTCNPCDKLQEETERE